MGALLYIVNVHPVIKLKIKSDTAINVSLSIYTNNYIFK